MKHIFTVPPDNNVVRDIDVRGGVVRGSLGPSDFPGQICICLEDNISTVYLLYYMAPTEAVEVHKTSKNVFVNIGTFSGRVMSFSIPSGRFGLTTLDNYEEYLKILNDLEEFLKDQQEKARKLPLTKEPARRIAHYMAINSLKQIIINNLELIRLKVL